MDSRWKDRLLLTGERPYSERLDHERRRQQSTTIDPRATAAYPAVSPDGRYIVFSSASAGTTDIWRMDIDGGNPKQLTSNGG